MAVTKIHPIKSTLKKALDYIENPDKTYDKMLVSSFACSYETADIEFEMLLAQAYQKGNNLAHHLIQSFAPGEATPEQAHEIGRQLADEVLQGKYPYVLTTHIDKGHVHNHIIFCAVDMQIRLDTPLRRRDDPPGKSGAKYIWLSSIGKPHGVTSSSPLHFVGEPFAKTVYVTEGLLKADIAYCLTGRSFVAVAGVNSLNGLESALRCMAQNGTKLVVEAYDMDKLENEYVASAAEKVQQIARVAGLQSTSLVWNTAYKGIDDWQLALRQEEAKEKAA